MTSTKQTPFPPKTPSPNLNLFIPSTTPPPCPSTNQITTKEIPYLNKKNP